MIRYNVPDWRPRQALGPLDGIGPLRLPVTHRYPISGRTPRQRAPLTGSLLLHVAVVCCATFWLPRRSFVPVDTDQPIEIVFQPPAEKAAALLQIPPVAPAPGPAEPPPPQRVEAAPPAPRVPLAPPVEQPPAAPLVPVQPPPPIAETLGLPPVPTPPLPLTAEPTIEAPSRPPKQQPPPPARPQPRPIARAQPQPMRAAPRTAEATLQPTPTPAPMEAPPAPISTVWRQAIVAWLAAHKSYPEEARRRGEQGTIALRFTVERSGRVTNVAIVRGSGSSILDHAAESMLDSATMPAFPATMLQDRVEVNVQVRYALTD